MVLFLVGVLEMIIVTTWTRMVTQTKVIAGGTITVVNILIWYYVLQTIVSDISNFSLIVCYALGCALGTMLTMYVSNFKEQRTMAHPDNKEA